MYDGNKSQIFNLKSQISNPDVCGAGDTVIAVATLALLIGLTLEEIRNHLMLLDIYHAKKIIYNQLLLMI
ncbi:MAG: hypothetical protein IPF58_18170 [Saprospirales bacterium]|nr:hypothetical protein [Saprospirales bacterium]